MNNLGADEPNPAYPFPLFESCLRAPYHGVEWVEERLGGLAGLSGLRALERLQMVRLLLSLGESLVLRLVGERGRADRERGQDQHAEGSHRAFLLRMPQALRAVVF